VDDIVSGIIAIVMVPHRLKIVNVTNEEEVSVNQMAQNALNVTG
jgi:nucleoside-diphosphate-sugar epimerase